MNQNHIRLLITFLLVSFFSMHTQGQIFEKLSNLFSPSSDTSSWELITIETINCQIKMPGQPTFELDSTFVNNQLIPFYSVSYESSIIENLSFEMYVIEFPPDSHSDSLTSKELMDLYKDEISTVMLGLNDNENTFEEVELAGHRGLSSNLIFFGDLVKLKYAVVLIGTTFYTFSIYYDSYPEKLITYFFDSFELLEK